MLKNIFSLLSLYENSLYYKAMTEEYASPEFIPPLNKENTQFNLFPITIQKLPFWENLDTYAAPYSRDPATSYNMRNLLLDNWEGASLYNINSSHDATPNIFAVTWLKEREFRRSAIPQEDWDTLNPDTIEQVNQFLLQACIKASQIYEWKQPIKGLLISGDWNLDMAISNVPYHVTFSFENTINRTINILQKKDPHSINALQIATTAGILHELTHEERHEDPADWEDEVISHAVQFMYNPEGNIDMKEQLLRTLDRIQQRRDQPGTLKESLDTYDKRLYDKARYIALLFIADRLTETNHRVGLSLKEDTDPYKSHALRELSDLVSETDITSLHSNIMNEFINIPRSQIEPQYIAICEKYNISQIESEPVIYEERTSNSA